MFFEPEGFKLVGYPFSFLRTGTIVGQCVSFVAGFVEGNDVRSCIFVGSSCYFLLQFRFVVPLDYGLPDLCVFHCLNRYYTSAGRPISAPFPFA
jgi:hypothetical protein